MPNIYRWAPLLALALLLPGLADQNQATTSGLLAILWHHPAFHVPAVHLVQHSPKNGAIVIPPDPATPTKAGYKSKK